MEVNVYAANTNLSRLIDQVNAGEEVVITRHSRPVVRLVPAEVASRNASLARSRARFGCPKIPMPRCPMRS